MEKCRKKHGEGNFQLRINEINALEIKEFQNPWSFHSLFISGDDLLLFLLLYVPCQQLWSLRDGQFT